MSTERKGKVEGKVDEAVADTFPASDPPASHIPDEPPVNADAKWEAAKRAEQMEAEGKGNERVADDPDAPPAKEVAAKRRIGSDTVFRN